MPVKRRKSKRRMSPIAEAEAWAMAFRSGHDFLCDLDTFGLETDKQVTAAMPEAWARLGRIFIDHGLGEESNGPPFALEQFGEPPCQ